MNNKIQLAAVSYLNTKPLLYGILQSPVADQISLRLERPSRCAELLEEDAIDIGLVPVATLAHLSAPRLISDYCIGTVGAVKTVGVFADRPIEEVEALYLDHHSRSSVELVKILLREYWKVEPELLPASEGYIQRMGGSTAGLVIGDRSIGLEERFAYSYDLGSIWMKHTGLPFVFAAWVATRPIDPTLIQALNEAMAYGLRRIPQLIYLLPKPHPRFDLETYFTRYISYDLDLAKKEALALFLEKMGQPQPASLRESLA